MIKATELRIGNWVEAVAKMGNYPMQILPFHIEAVSKNPECANPITLTPAILYAAGFSTPHNHMSTVVAKDGIMIDYHLGKFRLRDNNRIAIDWLHQLQNLYFALTGEELTIKELV